MSGKWRQKYEFCSKDIARALKYVLKAVSRDETRVNLNGVLWVGDGFVSCDGHRCHTSGFKMKKFLPKDSSFILSFEHCKNLLKMLPGQKTVEIARSNRSLCVETNKGREYFAFSDKIFPPYKHVFPVNDWSLEIDSKAFLEVAREVKRGMKGSNFYACVLSVGREEISLEDEGDNGLKKRVAFLSKKPLENRNMCAQDDGTIRLGMNLNYLISAVPQLSGKFLMQFSGPLDPITFVSINGRKKSVVMPTRI